MRGDHPLLVRRKSLERRGHRSPWVALFDIDSTLMDTGPRNVAILEAAFEALPELSPWRSRWDGTAQSWNVLEPLRRIGVEESTLARVQAFWADRFFTDAWLVHDRPYPGVAEFLGELKAEGFRLAYLTGRHTGGMEAGTRKSFFEHGLPCGPEEHFLFKPTFTMSDGEFKEAACDRLSSLGTVVVSVDNEPANVNLFRRRFPEAQVVWVDTVTSPDPEPLAPGVDRADVGYFLTYQ